MNARQRRALKRVRPRPGAVVHFREDGEWCRGVVSDRQVIAGPHSVRVDYDNGSFRTWGFVRVLDLKPHPDGFYTSEEIR